LFSTKGKQIVHFSRLNLADLQSKTNRFFGGLELGPGKRTTSDTKKKSSPPRRRRGFFQSKEIRKKLSEDKNKQVKIQEEEVCLVNLPLYEKIWND